MFPLLDRRSFLSLAALTAACGTSPRSASASFGAAPRLRVVDTLPTFFAFWQRAAGLPLDEQVALFESDVVAAWPALYAPNVLGLRGDDVRAILRQRIGAWLPTLPPVIDQLRALHAQFAKDVDDATTRFAAALPDFSWDGVCYAFASVDGLNGGVRDVDGKASLVFGLDVVAKNQASMPLPVLFAHELFHVHHAAVMVSPPVSMCIADAMWSEGLATFASTVLVPNTSDGQALPISHVHDPAEPVLDAPERRVALDSVMPELASSLGAEPALVGCLARRHSPRPRRGHRRALIRQGPCPQDSRQSGRAAWAPMGGSATARDPRPAPGRRERDPANDDDGARSGGGGADDGHAREG